MQKHPSLGIHPCCGCVFHGRSLQSSSKPQAFASLGFPHWRISQRLWGRQCRVWESQYRQDHSPPEGLWHGPRGPGQAWGHWTHCPKQLHHNQSHGHDASLPCAILYQVSRNCCNCWSYAKKIKTFREEFWNADTGEIICNVTAQYGDEKYGSTDDVFNEKDYITILPCIYGFQPGLQVQYKTVLRV